MVVGLGSLPKSQFPAGLPRYSSPDRLRRANVKDLQLDEENGELWAPLMMVWHMLNVLGICGETERPTIVAEWAADDLIRTRAKLLFVGTDPVQKNAPIPPLAWRYASEECSIEWGASNLSCKGVFVKDRSERLQVRARSVEVDMISVRDLLPLDPDDIREAWDAYRERKEAEEALAQQENTPTPPPAETSPRLSSGGKGGRSLSKHWPLFVAELALWIEEANDDPALLTPGKLIGKLNDRLAKKGIEEMPPSTAEETIKAVLAALQNSGR
jgi:hypothetical protein